MIKGEKNIEFFVIDISYLFYIDYIYDKNCLQQRIKIIRANFWTENNYKKTTTSN